MKYHDEPIPRNRKGKIQNKKLKSDQANADISEDGRNYGLEHLNLGEPAQDSENDSECLLTKIRESQRAKNKNNSIKRKCNVLSNFLNPMKRAKHKISHYSPILQGCMDTSS